MIPGAGSAAASNPGLSVLGEEQKAPATLAVGNVRKIWGVQSEEPAKPAPSSTQQHVESHY